jgi:Tfp pilus assembly protein PilX
MIIAWVLCMIMMVTSLVSQLGHSAALQIRLLTIEEEAHVAFVAAENKLNQCEAQLSNAALLNVPNVHDASTACDITVVDANARGELIRIHALGSAIPKQPTSSTPNQANQGKQTVLESTVYRSKQDQSIERLSWRVLWSEGESVKRNRH